MSARALACCFRRLAENIRSAAPIMTIPIPLVRSRRLLARCVRASIHNAATIFSSIAMGVGNDPTSTVVRVGFGFPGPAKYSG